MEQQRPRETWRFVATTVLRGFAVGVSGRSGAQLVRITEERMRETYRARTKLRVHDENQFSCTDQVRSLLESYRSIQV